MVPKRLKDKYFKKCKSYKKNKSLSFNLLNELKVLMSEQLNLLQVC